MTMFVGYFDQPNPGVATKMEDTIGVGFRAVRLNYGFNDENGNPKGGGKYLDNEYDRILGRWGFAPRGFWNMNIEPPFTFAMVAAGECDEAIRSRAELIKTNPRWTHDHPLFVSPHHEQSVDTLEQPGGGDPKDYPAFFQRVFEIFKEEKVLRSQGGSVMLCFVPTVGQFLPVDKLPERKKQWHVDAIAPNPKHYQYAGCDIYSKPDYKRPDASDLDNVNAWAKKVGKKFIIGECGASMSTMPGQQASWIDDVHKRLRSYGVKDEAGSCNMVAWTFKDFPDGTSTRVDKTPLSMDVFSDLMHDKDFQRKL